MKVASHVESFDMQLKTLKFIADCRPRWVSRAEVGHIIGGSSRKHQRTLQGLVSQGYLICDRCNPIGYKINEHKIKELQIL